MEEKKKSSKTTQSKNTANVKASQTKKKMTKSTNSQARKYKFSEISVPIEKEVKNSDKKDVKSRRKINEIEVLTETREMELELIKQKDEEEKLRKIRKELLDSIEERENLKKDLNTSRYKKYRKGRVKTGMFKFKLIASIISLLFIISFSAFLFILDILPIKYIIPIIGVLVLLNLVGTYLIDPKKKFKVNIVGGIILLLTILISGIGTYYLASTNNFLNKSFSKFRYEKTTYYIVGLKKNNLEKKDITGDISVYNETIKLDKALTKLKDKYEVTEKRYDDVGVILDNMTNNTDKLMLVEKSSYGIVFSISKQYKKEDFEIIDEFNIITKVKNKKKNIEKFNIYFGGQDFSGLRDFNMIITVNTKTHRILLTSIPRDYYLEVPGKGGRRDKLSFMSAYGTDINKEALEKAFGTNIDYSLLVETGSLVDIVDYVGGIDFCSDYEYTTTHALTTTDDDRGRKLYVKKGCQHVNGIEALTISRERNAFPGRDRVRQENCQKILIAIVKKLISTDTMLHYNETLNTLSDLYTTDMPRSIFSNFAKDIINNGNKWKFETQSVDGTDGQDKVHLSNITDWVMYPDMKTVDKAKQKINKTLK